MRDSEDRIVLRLENYEEDYLKRLLSSMPPAFCKSDRDLEAVTKIFEQLYED